MNVRIVFCVILLLAMVTGSMADVVLNVTFDELSGSSISDGQFLIDSSSNKYDGFWGGDKTGSAALVEGADGGIAVDSSNCNMLMYLRDAKTYTGHGSSLRPDPWTTTSPYFTIESSKSYTFEAVLKWDASSSDTRHGIMGQIGGDEFWIREDSGSLQWAMKSGTITANNFGTGADVSSLVNDGQWHHIALVLDRSASEVRAYADGVLIYTDTSSSIAQLGSMLSGTSDFFLGGYRADIASQMFDGSQDGYAISDSVLGPDSFVMQVPEPATMILLGLGSLVCVRRRNNK